MLLMITFESDADRYSRGQVCEHTKKAVVEWFRVAIGHVVRDFVNSIKDGMIDNCTVEIR